MSSETSTEPQALPPWQFFTLAGLIGATIAVLAKGGLPPWLATHLPDAITSFFGSGQKTSAAVVILLSLTIFSAAAVGLAMVRTLVPLTRGTGADGPPVVAGRTRAGLEREKTLALRSIKELEFDRAMDKVSEKDFVLMSARLRERAARIMRQLDAGSVYAREIDKEIERRLAAMPQPRVCACGVTNDPDARFCKSCGKAVA